MVSPYLSRPLRSLREALESGRTPPRRSESAQAWPMGGLLGATEAAARPESANSLAPPATSPVTPLVTPLRPFTVVGEGAPGPSPRDGPRDGPRDRIDHDGA